MPVVVDVIALLLVGLAAYAEFSRGLLLTATDLLRIAGTLILGLAAYSLVHRLFHNYVAGFTAFGAVALLVILLVPAWLRNAGWDPSWAKNVFARVAAGVAGAGLGLAICATFVPVLSRTPEVGLVISRSHIGRPFLALAPAFFYLADGLNLDLPMLNASPVRFEDEGESVRPRLVERVNYSRLDGSACINCGGSARFAGYRRRFDFAVSPLFECSECGRTSDGCQTYEGFHRMYGRCPVAVAADLGPIDCGVWPSGEGVQPRGPCPVDGTQH